MVIALLAAAAVHRAAASAPCQGLLSDHLATTSAARDVTIDDLARLRDFGSIDDSPNAERPMELSPDGRRVALVLRRGDPRANRFCTALVVVDIATRRALILDEGGDLIRASFPYAGHLANFPSGIPVVVRPQWSPDGRWLAFLKKTGPAAQLWRVRAGGGGGEQLTHEREDVTAFGYSRDGRRLVYQTDRAIGDARKAIAREGLSGWHYDDRSFPLFAVSPFPAPSKAQARVSLDLATRHSTPAAPGDRDLLTSETPATDAFVRDRSGAILHAWSTPARPEDYESPSLIHLKTPTIERTCSATPCVGANGIWFSDDRRTVLFLSRSGWGNGDLTFYAWDIATGALATLSSTSDLLTGCTPLAGKLLCARERSTEPRRLVLIDPRNGRADTIFDPNPAYVLLRQSRVERLRLHSANGAETFADLVLPPDFVPGRHYPLIVVQYESRGFLRGGTGDEYPIPAFASARMIVLSFQRPRDVAASAEPPPTDDDDFFRKDVAGWNDRRNVQSALLDGVNQVMARGIVDPERVGITGLSDGVGTVVFALNTTHVFKAAAISGGNDEPVNQQTLMGPTYARFFRGAGFPSLTRPDPSFWARYSLRENAKHLSMPLLIQAPEQEFRYALEAYSALEAEQRPVDFFVYPDEFHIKWQPAHRLALYRRNLAWFCFWFDLPYPHGADPTPDELGRWEKFAAARQRDLSLDSDAAPMPPRR